MIIVGLTLFRASLAVWKHREILKVTGLDIPVRKIIPPFFSGFPLMFFAPEFLLSGDFLRGYALQKTEDLSWRKTMGAVVVDRLLDWGVSLTSIFLGVFIFLYKIGLPTRTVTIIILGVLFGLGIGLFFLYLKNFREESILKLFGINEGKAVQVEQEVHGVFQSGWRKWTVMLIPSLLIGLVRLMRVWLLAVFLGEAVSMITALPLLAFFYLGSGVPIPASLGVHEVIQTFGFRSLGLTAGSATAFSMILRGAELVLALLGVAALVKVGWHIFQAIILDKLNGRPKS